MHTTPVTLLERLRESSDDEAWSRFVQLYTPLLFHWARRCGLQTDDAADLTQDVLTTVFQRMPTFAYDEHKSFRAWLHTVTVNRWRDRRRRIADRQLPGYDGRLASLPGRDDLAMFEETEYREALVNRALRIMQVDFEPTTWQAFWEHGVAGKSARDVAAELELTVAAVYCAKLRVVNRLRQELAGLIG